MTKAVILAIPIQKFTKLIKGTAFVIWNWEATNHYRTQAEQSSTDAEF